MQIALAQINSVVGDFAGNRKKILAAVDEALARDANLVVFPELSLFGYAPMDLLERESVIEAQLKEFKILLRSLPNKIAVVIGLITHSQKKIGKPYHNSAAFLVKGQKPRFFHKDLLPTYDVFDEARFVERGDLTKNIITFAGKKILFTVCEDIWGWPLPKHPSNYLENPLLKLKRSSCDLVVNISASPFTHKKAADRLYVAKKTASHLRAPLVYVNLVGGQDELVFDGGSFVVNPAGQILAQSPRFIEDVSLFSLKDGKGSRVREKLSRTELTRRALVLGLRDFVAKTGQNRVHLGLSGGIDSAVVACLAVEALGAENVTCVTMPGPFNAEKSKTLAEQLALALRVRLLDIPIHDAYSSALKTLEQSLGTFEFGLTNENMQARLRGLFLMALSNKESSMLLTTGNKSEYATGYATLYGDMCGGLAPLGDLLKEEVFQLAALYNLEGDVIPQEIITRPPSAELRPNQTDQDSLPPYSELDRAVQRLVEEHRPARNEMERWLLKTINRNEFKRWQAPPILKVSPRSFGRGRRYPIANSAKS